MVGWFQGKVVWKRGKGRREIGHGMAGRKQQGIKGGGEIFTFPGHSHRDLLPPTRSPLPTSNTAVIPSVDKSSDGYHTPMIQSPPKHRLKCMKFREGT